MQYVTKITEVTEVVVNLLVGEQILILVERLLSEVQEGRSPARRNPPREEDLPRTILEPRPAPEGELTESWLRARLELITSRRSLLPRTALPKGRSSRFSLSDILLLFEILVCILD